MKKARAHFADLLSGEFRVDHRAMLDCSTGPGTHDLALNDVLLKDEKQSRLVRLEVWADGEFVTEYTCDGLIFSTPTGSTAYNLAAGGPIVHPRADAIILTPIAPHTLTNRPIIIPGSEVIEVRPQLQGNLDEIFVTYDGQSGYPLQEGDVVRVRRSERCLKLIKAPARSYFELLREKLKWGERGSRD